MPKRIQLTVCLEEDLVDLILENTENGLLSFNDYLNHVVDVYFDLRNS